MRGAEKLQRVDCHIAACAGTAELDRFALLQDIAAGLVESIAGGDAQQPVLAGDGPDLGLLGGILLVLDNSKQVADEQSPHEHSR